MTHYQNNTQIKFGNHIQIMPQHLDLIVTQWLVEAILDRNITRFVGLLRDHLQEFITELDWIGYIPLGTNLNDILIATPRVLHHRIRELWDTMEPEASLQDLTTLCVDEEELSQGPITTRQALTEYCKLNHARVFLEVGVWHCLTLVHKLLFDKDLLVLHPSQRDTVEAMLPEPFEPMTTGAGSQEKFFHHQKVDRWAQWQHDAHLIKEASKHCEFMIRRFLLGTEKLSEAMQENLRVGPLELQQSLELVSSEEAASSMGQRIAKIYEQCKRPHLTSSRNKWTIQKLRYSRPVFLATLRTRVLEEAWLILLALRKLPLVVQATVLKYLETVELPRTQERLHSLPLDGEIFYEMAKPEEALETLMRYLLRDYPLTFQDQFIQNQPFKQMYAARLLDGEKAYQDGIDEARHVMERSFQFWCKYLNN